MTMTMTPNGVDRVARMSLSSMCRDGNHKTCKELRMRCSCSCHDPEASMPASSTKRSTTKRPGRTLDIVPEPVAKRLPVIELVKAEPPAIAKKTRISLAEQVRPLLEQILTDGDRDWFRVVLFFKARQAAMNLKRLRDAHSKAEWEWRSAQLNEVEQSAIYVRWVGQDKRVV